MSPVLDERLFAEVGFPRVSGDEPTDSAIP